MMVISPLTGDSLSCPFISKWTNGPQVDVVGVGGTWDLIGFGPIALPEGSLWSPSRMFCGGFLLNAGLSKCESHSFNLFPPVMTNIAMV